MLEKPVFCQTFPCDDINKNPSVAGVFVGLLKIIFSSRSRDLIRTQLRLNSHKQTLFSKMTTFDIYFNSKL